jgi:hypothetical protein
MAVLDLGSNLVSKQLRFMWVIQLHNTVGIKSGILRAIIRSKLQVASLPIYALLVIRVRSQAGVVTAQSAVGSSGLSLKPFSA